MGRPSGITLARYGLPAVLIVGGILAIAIDGGSGTVSGAGVVVAGIGLMVALLNWLFRLSVASNDDRDREEAARDYFSRHGHWPGEGSG